MSKTIKTIAILSAFNLIIFSLCFYLFSDIKKIDKEVSLRLTQIESEAKLDESLRSIKLVMNETKKERDQIALIFLQPNGTVDFIEKVESLGRVAGVKLEIESVGIDNPKNKTATASSTELFRISLKTKGSWVDTMHLLSLLENMPHKLSFESVRLSKVSGESSLDGGKEQTQFYWGGNFSFSALKIKNPPETANVAN